jgi:hypothetical protein
MGAGRNYWIDPALNHFSCDWPDHFRMGVSKGEKQRVIGTLLILVLLSLLKDCRIFDLFIMRQQLVNSLKGLIVRAKFHIMRDRLPVFP